MPRVRDAQPGDAAAIAGLLTELGYPASEEAASAHVARFSADPASRLLVALDERQRVAGLMATHIVPRLDDDAYTVRITDIVVAEVDHRQGIGTALLRTAEDSAVAAGITRLDLTSGDWRDNAHAFYTAQGFTSVARGFTKRLGQ